MLLHCAQIVANPIGHWTPDRFPVKNAIPDAHGVTFGPRRASAQGVVLG